MKTQKTAAALFAVAMLFAFAGAVTAADTAPAGDETKKECCHHAKAGDGEAGAHCARHAKGGKTADCSKHDGGKACCAEGEKSGKGHEKGECCCCSDSCDHGTKKDDPARS